MINYNKQINVDKILNYSNKRLLAGEDGYIKISTSKNENKEDVSDDNTWEQLESMTGSDGFLSTIEDADEYSNGDILVCTTDGDFGLYKNTPNPSLKKRGNNPENNYTLKKLDIKIKDDCIYNIKIEESVPSTLQVPSRREGKEVKRSFECWGERGVTYNFEI